MIPPKQVDPEKSKELLGRLDEVPDPILSVRQFINQNFDTLQKSGKELKALHDFFVTQGVDLGSFKSFQATYSSVKRSRKNALVKSVPPEKISEPEKTHEKGETVIHKPEKIPESVPEKDSEKTPVKEGAKTDAQSVNTDEQAKNRGLGLRPIYLADGKTEVIIDPNTGGRRFKI